MGSSETAVNYGDEWRNSDEVKFIDSLGRALLIEYQKAMSLREDWGDLDSPLMDRVVEDRLEETQWEK